MKDDTKQQKAPLTPDEEARRFAEHGERVLRRLGLPVPPLAEPTAHGVPGLDGGRTE